MSRSYKKKGLLIIAFVLAAAFTVLSEDIWLTVNGSDEVSISSCGYLRYYEGSVFVVVVNGAQPENTFADSPDTYRFCAALTGSSAEYRLMVELVEAGIFNDKKFRIGLNVNNEIVKILVVS